MSGWIPMPRRVLDRVLGRFGLELAGGADLGQPGDVHVQDVPAADVLAHLADGLEEGQRLDVSHRPAHLDDHDPVLGQAAGGDAAGALAGDARIRSLISLVMCGITCTVPPR